MQISLWFCFVGVLILVVVCALFLRRSRPNAYSHEELNQIRIDRELAKEVKRNVVLMQSGVVQVAE